MADLLALLKKERSEDERNRDKSTNPRRCRCQSRPFPVLTCRSPVAQTLSPGLVVLCASNSAAANCRDVCCCCCCCGGGGGRRRRRMSRWAYRPCPCHYFRIRLRTDGPDARTRVFVGCLQGFVSVCKVFVRCLGVCNCEPSAVAIRLLPVLFAHLLGRM